jgi:hypothetical protein
MEVAIMNSPDEPNECASSEEEEAELRAMRRVASALERGEIYELAAALLEEPDPPWPASGSHGGPKEN